MSIADNDIEKAMNLGKVNFEDVILFWCCRNKEMNDAHKNF